MPTAKKLPTAAAKKPAATVATTADLAIKVNRLEKNLKKTTEKADAALGLLLQAMAAGQLGSEMKDFFERASAPEATRD